MKKNNKIILFILGLIAFIGILVLLSHGVNFAMLSPKGLIALEQKRLMLYAFGLMALVVIPVFGIAVYIIYKYRDKNSASEYNPNLQADRVSALALWLVSGVTIGIIGVIIWESSHRLDPYKKIQSDAMPLTVQVVALNWKWLFIYPDQNIATVNYLVLPKGAPVTFKLTADAPMNIFWIPQLGGQVYAMSGMQNELNLVADKPGEYWGTANEINGKGFSGMRFKTMVVEQERFDGWLKTVKSASKSLTGEAYENLRRNSENNPPDFFASVEPNLFEAIINRYMGQMPEAGTYLDSAPAAH